MKFLHTETYGWRAAMHGMRSPLSSWQKSDSFWKEIPFSEDKEFCIGPNDKDLALRLIKAGPEHAKFLRQIYASVDITMSRFWWIEAATYRFGVEVQSTSTMHTIHKRPFVPSDFAISEMISEKWSEADNFSDVGGQTPMDALVDLCVTLNKCRDLYLSAKESGDNARAKMFWKQMILLLPQSYLQERTVTFSYAALANICRQRKGHKLTEWAEFIDWCHTLPNSWLIFGEEEEHVNEV